MHIVIENATRAIVTLDPPITKDPIMELRDVIKTMTVPTPTEVFTADGRSLGEIMVGTEISQVIGQEEVIAGFKERHVLPEGDFTLVEIDDAERAKFSQNARFTLNPDGKTVDVEVVPIEPSTTAADLALVKAAPEAVQALARLVGVL